MFVRKNIAWKLALPLPLCFILCLLVAWHAIPQAIVANTEKVAIQSAIQTVLQFKILRRYYTENVIDKVVADGGLTPSFDHSKTADGVPLPATLIHDLSAELKDEKTSISLYSVFPFPPRKSRVLDDFQAQAWDMLNKNPKEVFTRREKRGDSHIVRVAVADTMSAKACVRCHNQHILSPKKDWKLGDVRGVLEVSTNIDAAVAGAVDLTQKILLGMLLASAGLIAIVVAGASTIATPIVRLTGTMNRLADGDLSVDVPNQKRIDEIGQMSRSVQVFKDNAKKQKIADKALADHRDHLQKVVSLSTREVKRKAEELENALDREKELNLMQRQFVSMASHEFRTPLTIIDSSAQRLKRQAGDGRLTAEVANARADKIRAAVHRMAQLMESTLSAARLQDGKIEVDIKDCDLGKVVREVSARQQEIAKDHNITWYLSNFPATIQANHGALEQVLTNLLSNAVKYAPEAPDIEVTATTEGDHVVILVRDYGVGIDEEDLNRIGERFFRAKTSTGITGTGIGLNVVNALLDLHAGSLDIESKKGKGSTFTIRLPIAGPPERVDATEISAA